MAAVRSCIVCNGPMVGMHGSKTMCSESCRAFREREIGRRSDAKRNERRKLERTAEVACVWCGKMFSTSRCFQKILCSTECKKLRDYENKKRDRERNVEKYRALARAKYASTPPEMRKTYPDRRNGAERYRRQKTMDPEKYLERARSWRKRNREKINAYQRELNAKRGAAVRLVKKLLGQPVKELSSNPKSRTVDHVRTRELYLKNRERLRIYNRKRYVERMAALRAIREMQQNGELV